MDLKELLKKLNGQIKSLAADPNLSDEKAEELKALMAQHAKVEAQIKAADLVAANEKQEAEEAEAKRQAEFDAAVKAEVEKAKVEKRRLPYKEGKAPVQAKFAELKKYDGLSVDDQAFLVNVLQSAKYDGRSRYGASDAALKALAVKMAETEPKSDMQRNSVHAMKATFENHGLEFSAIKSDEIMQSDLASYGDEWVGIAQSNSLWESIRQQTFIVDKLPQIEVPQGMESIYLPLESGDPTYYNVAQASDNDGTNLAPLPTISSSRMGTARAQLTLGKMGARTQWTGELEEDSVIPFVNQLRMQMIVGGAENLEHAIIDGDDDGSASTNINDIAGTPAGTEAFTVVSCGFRKLALVTNTANAYSAAGGLTADDYLKTAQLLGTAGINALDKEKVGFIVDMNTYWASMRLAEVKTRDVFSPATIENGMLTGLWGYKIYPSAMMHKASTVRKANSAGKIDVDVTDNNLYGAILAVRFDQWRFGWKRRMKIETVRRPESDSTDIVATMRFGLKYRDTDASAIAYYVGV